MCTVCTVCFDLKLVSLPSAYIQCTESLRELSSSWHHHRPSSSLLLLLFEPFPPNKKREIILLDDWSAHYVLHLILSQRLTASLFCRSLSRSVRILCCSARSALRFSWRSRHHNGKSIHRCQTYLEVMFIICTWKCLTIRWVSLMSSSSSFFLFSKWASMSVCSSVRSFSMRLRWISWGDVFKG